MGKVAVEAIEDALPRAALSEGLVEGTTHVLDWDELFDGVVTVCHRTPTCTCGWTGRRRAALFLARHDAWMHAAVTGCRPGMPFVVAVSRYA